METKDAALLVKIAWLGVARVSPLHHGSERSARTHCLGVMP
jgi:hypothetical protein